MSLQGQVGLQRRSLVSCSLLRVHHVFLSTDSKIFRVRMVQDASRSRSREMSTSFPSHILASTASIFLLILRSRLWKANSRWLLRKVWVSEMSSNGAQRFVAAHAFFSFMLSFPVHSLAVSTRCSQFACLFSLCYLFWSKCQKLLSHRFQRLK